MATSIHLLSLLIWSQLVCQAICLACICASSSTSSSQPPPPPSSSCGKHVANQSTGPSCEHSVPLNLSEHPLNASSVCLDSSPNQTEEIHKQPRLAGDGAPSSSNSNLKQLCESDPELSNHELSNQKSPPPTPTDPPLKSNQPRPLFYTHEPDLPECCTDSTEPQPSDNLPHVIYLAPDYVFSKTLDFLTNSHPNPFSTDDSCFILRRLCSDPALRNNQSPVLARKSKTKSTSHLGASSNLHGRYPSVSVLPELEQLEYDELVSDMTEACYQTGLTVATAVGRSGDELVEDLNDQDSQLLHLLDTLSSLLTMQPTRNDDNLNGSTNGDTEDGSLQVTMVPNSSQNPEFASLAKKANSLTEDLNGLEAVVDELHYKLKANQIELEQAEDNLDFMWHLRDHLDQSGSETSSSYSSGSNSNSGSDSPVDPDQELSMLTSSSTSYWTPHLTGHGQDTIPILVEQSSPLEKPDFLTANNPSSISSDHSQSSLLTSSEAVDSHSSHLSIPPSRFVPTSDDDPMTTSMPESQLLTSHHKLIIPSNYDSYNAWTMKSTRSLRLSYRRHNHRRKSFYSYRPPFMLNGTSARRYTSEILPDADGFYHPDFIFEKDGIIDWSDSGLTKQQDSNYHDQHKPST